MFEPTARQDALAKTIVDAAFNVHQGLGPGLLESVYQQCLHHELSIRSIEVRTQVALPVLYKGITIPAGLRMDMVVANEVVLEIKAVEKLLPVHDAQLLTYLRLAGLKLGFLINFNVPLIKQGIKRMLNARTRPLAPSLLGGSILKTSPNEPSMDAAAPTINLAAFAPWQFNSARPC